VLVLHPPRPPVHSIEQPFPAFQVRYGREMDLDHVRRQWSKADGPAYLGVCKAPVQQL